MAQTFVLLFISYDQLSERNSMQGFILAHGFRQSGSQTFLLLIWGPWQTKQNITVGARSSSVLLSPQGPGSQDRKKKGLGS